MGHFWAIFHGFLKKNIRKWGGGFRGGSPWRRAGGRHGVPPAGGGGATPPLNDSSIGVFSKMQRFARFQEIQLDNLVDFEKCCKTHTFLQKSVPIQPKTSNILPKFCQPTLSDVAAMRWVSAYAAMMATGVITSA